MQVDRRDIDSNLTRKGFIKDEQTKHTYFHHEHGGKRTGVSTFTSRGSQYKSYTRELLGQIKKQLFLDSTRQVVDLCTCPMDIGQYIEILRRKGKIDS